MDVARTKHEGTLSELPPEGAVSAASTASSVFDPALLAAAVSIVEETRWKEDCKRNGVSWRPLRKWKCIAANPVVLRDLETAHTKDKRRFRRRGTPYALADPHEVAEQRAGDRNDLLEQRPAEWREILDPEEFADAVTVEEQEELKAAFDAPVAVAENKARAAAADVRANETLVAELLAAGERLGAVEKEATAGLEDAKARREEFLSSKSPTWREALLAAVSMDRTRPRDAASKTSGASAFKVGREGVVALDAPATSHAFSAGPNGPEPLRVDRG